MYETKHAASTSAISASPPTGSITRRMTTPSFTPTSSYQPTLIKSHIVAELVILLAGNLVSRLVVYFKPRRVPHN